MKPKWVITHAPHLAPKLSLDEPAPPPVIAPPKIYQYSAESYGPALWEKLHLRALNVRSEDTDWLQRFEKSIPCGVCRSHWKKMLAATPPDWEFYFNWTVERHNEVNAKLGKSVMTFEQAAARWHQNELVNRRG